jgi:hypothetical protein
VLVAGLSVGIAEHALVFALVEVHFTSVVPQG